MRRNRVLQAAVSASVFGIPAALFGQSAGTYMGPMDVPSSSFSALPTWTTPGNWSASQIPGITAGVGTAIFANINQPLDDNQPYGGNIAVVENQANITLSAIDIYNNIQGASIYSPASGQTTINFAGAGTINVPGNLSYA